MCGGIYLRLGCETRPSYRRMPLVDSETLVNLEGLFTATRLLKAEKLRPASLLFVSVANGA